MSENSNRAVPFYCPFCGDEDLRPHEEQHGQWHCRSCARVFTLRMVGLALGTPTSFASPGATR